MGMFESPTLQVLVAQFTPLSCVLMLEFSPLYFCSCRSPFVTAGVPPLQTVCSVSFGVFIWEVLVEHGFLDPPSCPDILQGSARRARFAAGERTKQEAGVHGLVTERLDSIVSSCRPCFLSFSLNRVFLPVLEAVPLGQRECI